MYGRTLTSAWIETLKIDAPLLFFYSRTPQGVRGLKPGPYQNEDTDLLSHSARSAWIETSYGEYGRDNADVALRKECVD